MLDVPERESYGERHLYGEVVTHPLEVESFVYMCSHFI